MKKILPLTLIFVCLFLLIAESRKTKYNQPVPSQTNEAKGDDAFNRYEFEKACLYWEMAVKENTKNVKIYNKLGICFLILKKYENSVIIFKEGLKNDVRNTDLRYNLALAYYYSEDFGKAFNVLEEILSINPYYPGANYLKGMCLEGSGNIKEAEKAYIEELNNNPGSRDAWKKIRALSAVSHATKYR